MLDLEGLHGRQFRMMLAALNYQALFGALALAGLILAAIAWHERTALFFALASSAMVIASQVMAGHALARSVFRGESKPRMIFFAQLLWYVAIGFAALSFASLT